MCGVLKEKARGQGWLRCRVEGAHARDEAEEGMLFSDGRKGRDQDMTKVWHREQRSQVCFKCLIHCVYSIWNKMRQSKGLSLKGLF